ncbi:hypothetical protein [Serratia symbiotica]|uniref:Uncharacterized protein n=1 Tax=Serratia symbiotica TaxID=138074 RepID=A0A7D5T106_9GAMM|nr:hypothetical protein [Serratia symbiotica]MBF1995105.1 hypothetical protein [Serratia symbiotica]MBQ0956343.1 hypothetical protein [Serratia symbiotica]QLH62801.1 hypothetical protein SYMBAF_07430 [Serratia symbiotica]QTP15499.1 hypothetical protein GPZ83_0006345 [Serratia symbiotica]
MSRVQWMAERRVRAAICFHPVLCARGVNGRAAAQAGHNMAVQVWPLPGH